MLLGILSDSHDDAAMTDAAVSALRQRGAAFLIHCGDVGTQEVLASLAVLPSAFVFGNNDFERRPLERFAQTVGIQCLNDFGELEFAGKRFAIMHGDDFPLRRKLLTDQSHDYLLHGHSHQMLDERVGRTRIINPGALHRARVKTAALLDVEKDVLEFLTIA